MFSLRFSKNEYKILLSVFFVLLVGSFVNVSKVHATTATLTLRPNGTGSETSITYQSPASTQHYDKVNEVTADDEATFVFLQGVYASPYTKRDLYALPDHTSETSIISQIEIFIRVRVVDTAHQNVAISQRTHSTNYESAWLTPGTSYVNYSRVSATNPYTGVAWTWAEIDALEVGPFLYADGSVGEPRCTQIYVVVTYTVNSPTITTPTQTSITNSGATLGGNVTSDGGATVTGRGVCVGTSSNPALGGTCFSTSGTTGVFTVAATSLTRATLYHYRAYATNSVGTSYTTDDNFTTLAVTPTITTPTQTSIHGSDATLGGNVTDDGGATVTGRGVCVGTSSNPAIGGTCFSTGGTTGVFTVAATGLTQSTLYHYRAYATNSAGTSYTTDDTFTTLALNNYLVTVVSPQAVGVCATGTNSITARDSTNTTITTDSSTVNMTSSGTGVTFYTTSGCSSSTTQYTMSSGTANIYYKTNLAQSFTITATKNGSTETGTSSSITVNPGSQAYLVITLPGQTFTAGSGNSGSVTHQTAGSQFAITNIRATDSLFNVITGYSGAKTLVYSGPSSTAGAPSYTTSVSFTGGVSTTTLNTTLNYAQSTTITVTDGGSYGNASSSLVVDPGTQTRLVVTFPGQTFTAGSGNSESVTHATAGSPFTITTITTTDSLFNVITSYSGAKTLAYSGPSSVAGAPSYTTSVSFTSGQSTTTLNTTLFRAETATITATDGGLYGYASSSLIVDPGAQTRLVITLPSQTFTAGSGNSGSVTNQVVDGQFTITSISATDNYFNVITGYSGSKTLVYTGPTATGGTAYTTAVSFTSGVSTNTLYTILTTAQTTTITVTDGGQYGYASASLTVSPTGVPSILIK